MDPWHFFWYGAAGGYIVGLIVGVIFFGARKYFALANLGTEDLLKELGTRYPEVQAEVEAGRYAALDR